MDGTNGQLVEALVDRIDRDGESTVVYLNGELDLLTSPGLQELLDAECERRPRRLRLDLAGVDFLDSSALRVFVHTHKRLAGESASLELVNCTPETEDLLSLIGLDWLLAGNPPERDSTLQRL
jgi:anti-sigma B factor antagonist